MAQQLAAREYAVIDEDALIERLRQGDEAAFEGLFLRHYAQVYRVLYHLVGSREEAEDLAQETFMALYHQPPATGMGASLVAWLCRVALVFSALSTSRGYARRNHVGRSAISA
jgi:RNA polymerase sigma-70 factor (ECF subfamily)